MTKTKSKFDDRHVKSGQYRNSPTPVFKTKTGTYIYTKYTSIYVLTKITSLLKKKIQKPVAIWFSKPQFFHLKKPAPRNEEMNIETSVYKLKCSTSNRKQNVVLS